MSLDEIGPDGLDLDDTVDVHDLRQALGPNAPFQPTQAGHLVAHLERLDDAVRVSGRARVDLEARCSRCLGPVPVTLDTPVDVTLFPKGAEPPPASDGEVAQDDLGVATYEDGEIDLAAVLHDEVFLELPMSPLCSESCAGLCPECGKDLNSGPCGCTPQQKDERWQALKRLKLS
ncbi:MAG: DUF177 domain-containing protein [Deltaproteobacteria bacterium]|nr:DUF177 domain-containing protein [Deltaproteobacteria bacterium]